VYFWGNDRTRADAITLGVVGQARFTSQNGRNQAYNHAGNTAGAAMWPVPSSSPRP
jgi:hypothetical protein